jgi:hypothetical protein
MPFEFINNCKTGYYLVNIPSLTDPSGETRFVPAKGTILLMEDQITAQVECLVKKRLGKLKKVEAVEIVEPEPTEDEEENEEN